MLVDPPMAMSTRMALRKESLDTMSLGLTFFLTIFTMRFPVSLAICSFLLSSASAVAHPVRLRPMVSVRHAMVLAVKSPEQLPLPGHAVHSTVWSSFSSIVPALYAPTASNTDWRSMLPFLPTPGSMAPPVTIRPGTFILPMAISIPGVTLSQLETPTHPSSA